MTKVNKKQVKLVADNSEEIGNLCYEEYKKTKKLEQAKTSLQAYRNTLYANNILIQSEKD